MSAPALPMGARVRAKTFPVVEIFGPTIQGEGAEAGLPTHFVRLGGCDYRCSWCDTMYAVDPRTVRDTARSLTSEQITAEVRALAGAPDWVALSGGNPALHELGPLVESLQAAGFAVSVETQGSLWRDWLGSVERLTISPKPPSSGMANARNLAQFERFMQRALEASPAASLLKIVCFDNVDLAWAKRVASAWPQTSLYLSAGTPVPAPARLRDAVGERYRWLCTAVAADPELARARVLPQLHVIAWEEARGV